MLTRPFPSMTFPYSPPFERWVLPGTVVAPQQSLNDMLSDTQQCSQFTGNKHCNLLHKFASVAVFLLYFTSYCCTQHIFSLSANCGPPKTAGPGAAAPLEPPLMQPWICMARSTVANKLGARDVGLCEIFCLLCQWAGDVFGVWVVRCQHGVRACPAEHSDCYHIMAFISAEDDGGCLKHTERLIEVLDHPPCSYRVGRCLTGRDRQAPLMSTATC